MATHNSPSTQHKFPDDRGGTIDDLVDLDAERDDTITEFKPDISATVTIPKHSTESLETRVVNALTSESWIQIADLKRKESVVVNGDELRVTGEFSLTTHYPVDAVTDQKTAIKATETGSQHSDVLTDVTDVSVRVPPYRTIEY